MKLDKLILESGPYREEYKIPSNKKDRIQDILSPKEHSIFIDYYYNKLSPREMKEKYNIDNISVYMGRIRNKINDWESKDIMDRNEKSDISNDEFSRNMTDTNYKNYGVEKDMKYSIAGILSTLSPREERALRLIFGFHNNGNELSYKELGEKMGVSPARAEQIVNKALRKLKHPTRSRKVRSYLRDE